MSRRIPFGPRKLAAATILGLAALGIGLGATPGRAGDPAPAAAAADPTAKPAIPDPAFNRLFEEGVAYMREGKVHEALVVFEAARKRQPKVPEVSANMGFAHLAAKNYPAAQREFEQALTVSPRQMNAYYGLAMALEAQGDLELAISAMRTFSHLEQEGSPFQRKAEAALWEWEEALRVKRGGEPIAIPPGSVGVRDHQPVTNYDQLRKDAP